MNHNLDSGLYKVFFLREAARSKISLIALRYKPASIGVFKLSAINAAAGDKSDRRALRPSSVAATPVVSEQQNESKTTSPGFV